MGVKGALARAEMDGEAATAAAKVERSGMPEAAVAIVPEGGGI
jgi:hypothetical protein